jgi:tRNA(Ile)-lysidine synthase
VSGAPAAVGRAAPAVAEVRRAVRAALAELPEPHRSAPLLVACSGGADSLALAAAAVALRSTGAVHAAVIDHGLQDGSAGQATSVVEVLTGLGAVAGVHRVEVSGSGGLEAAARRARYAALRAAMPHEHSPVLLGHTLDDQAETVLLGLGRGSGGRSLAGMRTWDAPWLRPLLPVRRATTRAACAAMGLPVWDDPHNSDRRFTRVRLRHEVLPLLEEVLSGGVAEALARTAAQLREDVDALDELAAGHLAAAVDPGPPEALRLEALAGLAPAVRRRVLRAWLAAAGVTALTDTHLRAADVLAGRGPDRGGAAMPGGLELVRERGRLLLRPVRWPGGSPEPAQEDVRRVRR